MIAKGTRRVGVVSLCAAALGIYVCADAPATATPAASGHCQLGLRVDVGRSHDHQGTTSVFRSTSGSASCTGMVGQWLMGGQTGSSSGQGRLTNGAASSTGGSLCLPASGSGGLIAEAPRFAWFYPAKVTFVATFRFHRVNGGLVLTGSGRLVKTYKSPFASLLRIAGTATLRRGSHGSCTAPHWSGALTLELAMSPG
jgi:hypothetical protein